MVESPAASVAVDAIFEKLFAPLHVLAAANNDVLYAVIAEVTKPVVETFVVESPAASVAVDAIFEKLFAPLHVLAAANNDVLYAVIAEVTYAVVDTVLSLTVANGVTAFIVFRIFEKLFTPLHVLAAVSMLIKAVVVNAVVANLVELSVDVCVGAVGIPNKSVF